MSYCSISLGKKNKATKQQETTLASEVTHKQAEVVYFFNFLKISFNCSLSLTLLFEVIRLQKKSLFQMKKNLLVSITSNNLTLSRLRVVQLQITQKTQDKKQLGTNPFSSHIKVKVVTEVILSLAIVNT